MDRTKLFDTLSNLPPAAFEQLLFAVNMPRMNRTGAAATIGEQVSALLIWAESPIGPGVEAIAQHLAELNHFEFDAYLRSLVATYEKWWTHYTLTDATGKLEQPQPEQPSAFDFCLMVQTVAREKDAPSPELRSEEREKKERLPVLDGIRKYADDHVLLVGRPGSGKSTALIKLVLDVADQTIKDGQGQIPILVELRYWKTSVMERIQAFLNRHDPSLSLDDAALNALLRQGRFLLLIDGLNELPSDEARTQLTTFRRDHPQVPMIFTTRDLGLGGDLGIEKKLEMQPLTEPQMKEFIRAYVTDQAEAMLRQLSERLREFGQTPLLLWMLCEVFQQSPNRQMPTNLAEVFRAFTTMYEDSSVRKHEVALLKGDVRPLSDRRLWKEALKALAALMMQGETPVDFRVAIHQAEAERELGRIFANEKFPIRDILDDLLKYHLLQRSTTDQIGFRHQLIQEYYAAEYLLPKLPELSNERLKRDYLNLLKWTEAITLMLALVDDEAQSLRVVKLAINDVDLMLGAQLAGKVNLRFQKQSIELISDFTLPDWLKVKVLEATQTDEVIPELRKAIKSQDHHVSRSAEVALTKLGSQAAISELRQALEEVYPNEPFSVAAAVVDLGGNVLTEDLLRDLQDKNADVRKMVAQALGELGDETAIPELTSTLNKDRDSSVRFSASVALGRLRSEAAIPELLKGLEDEELHWEAERVLQELGSKKAIRGLIKILDEHEDSAVRSRAVKVLGNLGGEEAISGLLKAFKDQDYHIRSGAERALEELKSETAIPELLKFLQNENLDVLRSAAHVLKTLGNETIIPELFKILKEELSHGLFNTIGEIEISGLLVSLSNDAATPILKEALNDEIFYVRLITSLALAKISNDDAIPELINALANENADVRTASVDALGELGSESAIFALTNKALNNKDADVRFEAAKALAKLGSDEGISELTQALSRQERSNHFAAIRALENLGNERALSVLTTTLSHEDTDVRLEAAKSLAKLGNEEGIHVLINVLNSGENKLYTHQQVDLVRALSQLKSEIVLFALTNACENEDKDKEVRQAAMLELANLSNDMAIPRLIAALRDKNEDPYLKFIAAWSLKNLNREKFISELFKAFQGDNHDLLLRVIESSGQMDNEMENKLLEALYGEGPDIRREAAEALGQMNNKAAIDWLLVALQYGHVKAGPALQNIKGDLAAHALPDLLTLIPTSSGQDAFRALTAIQNHCQFYNYEIFKDIIPQGNTISLYVSYAAADEVLQIQLANHLILLERQGVITSWSSHQILPGGDRTQTIHQQLNTADIILLLISPDAIADDTCYHLEIQHAMELHQSGEARVIPILLRPVDWQGASFSQLDMLPKNHQPVTTWQNQDEAFQEIAAGIREIALELRRNAPTAG